MEKFTCQECGNEFKKSELDRDFFDDGEYYCQACTLFLLQCGQDAIDPHWDEE
ncbi:hypothetical protein IGJ66_000479 [Enterococcus sp. DIV0176]|uniref:hypothetical protein n=1 Tax=Enterococcus sp. DIV0176 TaxID=2774758 RepID=UPI003D2FCB60